MFLSVEKHLMCIFAVFMKLVKTVTTFYQTIVLILHVAVWHSSCGIHNLILTVWICIALLC